ncbi:ACT domain-containing protein, partial [Archangium sp.]|uniref:ACT domain-containing protein n=1 Tax=Archangium sp. TaxID=1872627 RepID=UPI002D70734E
LWVKSSFTDDPGTLVCEEDKSMENVVVSGIAYDKNEAKLAISGVPDTPGVAAKIFGALDAQNIVVDLIVQTASREGRTDVSFTVVKTDLARAKEIVERLAKEIHAGGLETDSDVAKVSIVGVGMRNHSGVAAKMFQVLASEGINIQIISTSEIKVSCLIHSKYTELAVRALHTAFGLDTAPAAG